MYEDELKATSRGNCENLIAAIIEQVIEDYKRYNSAYRRSLRDRVDDKTLNELLDVWSFYNYHKEDDPRPKGWLDFLHKKSEIEETTFKRKIEWTDRLYLSAVGFFKGDDYKYYAALIDFPYTGEEIMAELDKQKLKKKVSRRAKKLTA